MLYELHRLYADTPAYQLAKIFGRPINQVYAKATQMGLHKSAAYLAGPFAGRIRPDNDIGGKTRFKKGAVPRNKGLRRPGWSSGRMRETQFKKGNRPLTWVPIGSYRVTRDGYLDRKVADHPPGLVYKNWVPVHRLVWIEHNGPIPHGHAVAFKPGQRTTVLEEITVDRLELVSRAELMRRNTYHNYPKEIAQLIQLRGALNRQINKRERQRNEESHPGPAKSPLRNARKPARRQEAHGARSGSGDR
jgi:hypothetical protein